MGAYVRHTEKSTNAKILQGINLRDSFWRSPEWAIVPRFSRSGLDAQPPPDRVVEIAHGQGRHDAHFVMLISQQ
jgi:hypothetical protein